jgi:hypothetical protein
MSTFEFTAHKTDSLFGEGDANSAERLCNLMNQHRALSLWGFRPVEKAPGPVLDIAAEIARHHAARHGVAQ